MSAGGCRCGKKNHDSSACKTDLSKTTRFKCGLKGYSGNCRGQNKGSDGQKGGNDGNSSQADPNPEAKATSEATGKGNSEGSGHTASFVSSLGERVNTDADETVAVQSSSYGQMFHVESYWGSYFKYRKKCLCARCSVSAAAEGSMAVFALELGMLLQNVRGRVHFGAWLLVPPGCRCTVLLRDFHGRVCIGAWVLVLVLLLLLPL